MRAALTVILATLAAACSAATPQTTIRRVTARPQAAEAPAAVADTIAATGSELRISGYDKPLRATREAFFVTSALPDTIAGLVMQIDYLDMAGRQLHSRQATISLTLPPGDTRRADIPTWDTQRSFYYHRSTPPRRARATPYQVKATVKAIIR